MKKSIVAVLACVTILFSSCLGDNENTYTGSDDFAVIKKNEGVLYATTYLYGLNLTWDGIDKYAAGDAVLLSSYHINYDNNSSSIVKADYANVSEDFPLANQLKVTGGAADTISNITNKIGLTSLSVLVAYPEATRLNDKWEIAYSYNQKEGEVYKLKFVYDATKQKLKGNDLPENTAIVDVCIEKQGEAMGTVVKPKTQNIVVNFDVLRTLLTPKNMTTSTLVSIHFRFSKEGANSTYENTNVLGKSLLYSVAK